jgi:hypothetical protein
VFVVWQLEVETVSLFDATITDMGISINYLPDGEDPIPSISDYIETMRISLWEIAFFREFAVEKGIHKNKSSEDQLYFTEAMRRILYRYFKFILFPRKACARTPAYFASYLDIDNEDCMFTESIIKNWDPVHFPTCGWYLDCPLKRPPSFEISLRESLEPALIGQVTIVSKPPPTEKEKKGRKKKQVSPDEEEVSTEKATTTSKRGSKRNADAVETAAPVAAAKTTSTVDKSAPPPAQSRPPSVETPAVSALEPAAKRMKLSTVDSSTPTAFLSPPKRGPMLNKPGVNVSDYTCLDLLVNDSFVRMADEKKNTGKFCPEYDEIVEFLKKVNTTSILFVSSFAMCYLFVYCSLYV